MRSSTVEVADVTLPFHDVNSLHLFVNFFILFLFFSFCFVCLFSVILISSGGLYEQITGHY